MTRLLQPLFALFATANDTKLRELVDYLKAEKRVLRDKLPARVALTAGEKAKLLKLGTALGTALKSVISIVSYRTFTRWAAGEKDADTKTADTAEPEATRKPGRPKTAEEIRTLVLKLATENGWGYTRILGELKKLGVTGVSRTTVKNILKAEHIDPGPQRGEGSWADFVTLHAATLWASDFVSVRTITTSGIVDLYLLFFIHVGSRRVIVSAPTARPDSAWVAQQARNATMQIADWKLPATHLLIDHDAKYAGSFDAVFAAEGTTFQRVGPRAPNMNAFAERWVQTLRKECLDHFLICGAKHLAHLVNEFVAHYNLERPHESKGNVPLHDADRPASDPPILKLPTGAVKCRERLGGLIKHY